MAQIKNFAIRSRRRNAQEDVEPAESAWNHYGRIAALLACIAGAIYLAHGDHEGWGWLIFLALVIK